MERFQSSRLEKSPWPRPPRCKLKLCNRNSCTSIHAGTYPAWPPIQIRSTEFRWTALCVGTVCKRTSSRGNKSWRHAVAMAAAPGAADNRSARQAANRVDKTTFMPRTLCIVLPGGPATHMHDIDRWQVQVPIEPPEAVPCIKSPCCKKPSLIRPGNVRDTTAASTENEWRATAGSRRQRDAHPSHARSVH